ncbi:MULTISPECIES: methyl-accepting chemotaxis protein [unclassified Roseibium]|uniref:methyl-accepting chemotaxis protein n=1 Tax=unclassified Roseibium TaxID=2629323 RepID=UPI00273D05B1|nr:MULTISPECIES: methyl-accepting chemotaxis protein [unclassified Roseibium]
MTALLKGLVPADKNRQIDDVERMGKQYSALFADVMALYAERDEIVTGELDVHGPSIRKNLSDIMRSAYDDGDRVAAYFAGRTQEHLMLARYYGKSFLLENDDASLLRTQQELASVEEELKKLARELQNPKRAELAQTASQLLQQYSAAFVRVADIIAQRNDILENQLDVIGPQILAQIDSLVDASVAQQDTIGPEMSQSFQVQSWSMGGVGLAGLIAGVLAAFFIARAITRPVEHVTHILEQLASGDVGASIPASERNDVIGRMLDACKDLRETVTKSFTQAQMIDQIPMPIMMADPNDGFKINYMNPTMTGLAEKISDHLDVPVSELLGTSIDTFHKDPSHQRRILENPENLPFKARIPFGGRRFSLKVSAIRDGSGNYIGPMVVWDDITEREQLAELVKASVDEVAQAIGQATRFADDMSSIATATEQQSVSVSAAAQQASNNVHSVAASTEEMSASVDEITGQISQSNVRATEANEIALNTQRKAEQLNENSQRIGDIVKMISDIAEQTNLLALNATIEAARAGEAGRGFAVVASEVKNLAEQTGRATVDIGEQIEAMQKVTSTTVSDIAALTNHIDDIASLLGAVAAATEEQGAATREISRNVTEAANGTQNVSQTIIEVRDASAKTGQSATELKQLTLDLSATGNALGEAAEKFLENVRAA